MNSSRRAKLADYVALVTGFPFKSAHFSTAAGIRLLRGDNVAQGRLRWDSARRLPYEMAADYENYYVAEDDVVLAMDRPWIEAGLKTSAIRAEDLPSLLVQRVARLRARDGLDQNFLRYVIASNDFTSYVKSVQTGTAVPHISGSQILRFEFLLPQPDAQRRMANLLRTLDDKIDLNRRITQNVEHLTVAAYEREVGQASVSTEMSDVADIVRTMVDPSREPREKYSLYSFEAFDRGGVPLEVDGSSVLSQKLIVPEGTVLVGKLNPHIPRIWLVDPSGVRPSIGSTEWLVMKPRPGYSPEVLYTICRSSLFQSDLASMVTGSTGSHQRIAAESLMRIRIKWPTPDAQIELERLFRPMLALVRQSRRESNHLVQLRDTLLPELISGRMTVN